MFPDLGMSLARFCKVSVFLARFTMCLATKHAEIGKGVCHRVCSGFGAKTIDLLVVYRMGQLCSLNLPGIRRAGFLFAHFLNVRVCPNLLPHSTTHWDLLPGFYTVAVLLEQTSKADF